LSALASGALVSGQGGDLVELGHVLGCVGVSSDSPNDSAVRRNDHVVRQDGDAVLLTGVG
jgi:hypothetical protein